MATTVRTPAVEKGEKKRFSQKLDDFLRAQRTVLIVVLAVIVAAVAFLAIYSAVRNSRINSSTQRIEQLASDFSSWAYNEDAVKKAEAGKSLTSSLEEVTKKWPRQFAAARAYGLLARIAEEGKDWTTAEKNWMAVYEHFPKIYLAPIALQNAAVAAEERGAADAAIAHYQTVVEKYSGKTVGVPHALFSIGRLAESTKDYASAIASYEKLLSLYADDDWTKLAKDRIIFLKAQGLGK